MRSLLITLPSKFSNAGKGSAVKSPSVLSIRKHNGAYPTGTEQFENGWDGPGLLVFLRIGQKMP